MAAVRNACVARGRIQTPTSTTIYTVPASTVLLLKSIILEQIGTATGQTQIVLNGSPSGPPILVYAAQLQDQVAAMWSGWVALNAADQIILVNVGIDTRYWLSGAVLPYNPGL